MRLTLRLPRYGPAARWYDVLSFERFVYREPRLQGISRLKLQAGQRVLDVACGTGLNFAPLIDAVGPTGFVVGIDASDAMLAVARRRMTSHSWANIRVEQGKAADLTEIIDESVPFDAVVITYALSIVDNWRDVVDEAVAQLRPGGQLLVIDLALPTGRWRALAPLARIACFTGGVHRSRRPWTVVADVLHPAHHEVARAGHVHLAWGTRS